MIRLKRILILFFLLLVCNSCNDTAPKRTNLPNQKFSSFLENIRDIDTIRVINLQFQNLDSESLQADVEDIKEFIPNLDGPLLLFGKLQHQKYTAVFYCTASANYQLNLITFNSKGQKISNVPIGDGCGAGYGYSCSEKLFFKSKKELILDHFERNFNMDSLHIGKEISDYLNQYKVRFSMNESGNIRIDTLEKSVYIE